MIGAEFAPWGMAYFVTCEPTSMSIVKQPNPLATTYTCVLDLIRLHFLQTMSRMPFCQPLSGQNLESPLFNGLRLLPLH
jgi:hypothetical protein